VDTIYLTKGQIETLFKLSQESEIGMELRSTASAESAVHLNSVLKDGCCGWTTILAEGDGPNVDHRGPVWER
jgi:hypothetical protein